MTDRSLVPSRISEPPQVVFGQTRPVDRPHFFPAASRAINVEELVRRAAAELAPRAAAANVQIALALSIQGMTADPDLMMRVIANLLDNAIRHAPEDSTVRVAIARGADGVELRVSDQGTGVPAELRDQIFERFQRAGAASTRANRGLGLAFCKLAVEAHGGRIWVEDGAPGAVFCVRIP